ncbi:MAG: hypothetical protein ABIR33_12695 [Pyrinomonadaceae bacterium]
MKVFTVAFIFILFCVDATAQTPGQIEAGLLKRLDSLAKWSNYVGSSDYEKLETENELLRNDLLKFGKIPATIGYAFPKLQEKMFIATSSDGRLRIYSWDRETGGTMHDFEAVFQYRGRSGKVYTWTEARDDEDYSAGVFYHDIFQANSAAGPVYLAISTFIGSTSLAGQNVNAVKINGEKLEPKAKVFRTAEGLTNTIGFGYDFFSVVDRPERPIKLFKFEVGKMELSFPIVIEDDKTSLGRVTNKFITYRFNGTHFVKVN